MEKFANWATRNLSGEKVLLYTLWKDLRSYFEINKQSNKHLRSLQAEHIHRTHFLMKDKKWEMELVSSWMYVWSWIGMCSFRVHFVS